MSLLLSPPTLVVDPVRRTARVRPETTCRELDAATQEHGLAVTAGRVADAPVIAAALDAGGGWLERRMGLPCDCVRAARVLTAGGSVVTASDEENPDLFWALRGGGTFGVVVELELALRPVGPEVLAGVLTWPVSRFGEVARAYRSLMADAPDALGGALELDGAHVRVVVLYTGTGDHLGPLRSLAPVSDTVAPTTYAAFQASPAAAASTVRFSDALSDAELDALTGPLRLRPLGGAYGRVGELDTAHPHRDAQWAIETLGTPTGALHAAGGTAERRARLAEVRDRWDPEGAFAE